MVPGAGAIAGEAEVVLTVAAFMRAEVTPVQPFRSVAKTIAEQTIITRFIISPVSPSAKTELMVFKDRHLCAARGLVLSARCSVGPCSSPGHAAMMCCGEHPERLAERLKLVQVVNH